MPEDKIQNIVIDYFLSYQKDWINDPHQISIRDKSRRTGGTETVAFESLLWGLETKMKSRDIWFTSADKKAAEEFIVAFVKWAKLFQFVAETVGEEIYNEDTEDKFFLKYEVKIETENGMLRVNALSSAINSFHGKQGFMIVDELARHKDQVGVWEGAFPATIWGYPLRIISTQNGKGLFYQICESCKKGKHPDWGYHHTDIYEAVEAGLYDKVAQAQGLVKEGQTTTKKQRDAWIESLRKNCLTAAVWNQQFLCKAEDEGTAFLSYELIYSCVADGILLVQDILDVHWNGANIKDGPDHPSSRWVLEVIKRFEAWFKEYRTNYFFFGGIDIARSKHLTVFWFSEKVVKTKITRIILEIEKMPYWVQLRLLYAFLNHKAMRRVCIDATGKGENLAEDAQLKYGAMVEPVLFTLKSKDRMAEKFRASFEDKTIVIPDDMILHTDLHSVQTEVSAAGNKRLVAQEEVDEDGKSIGHADRFWAGALMENADDNNTAPFTGGSRGKRSANKIMKGFDTIGEIY